MNEFTQHIPTFVDVDYKNTVYKFETTEDLLNLEVVQRYGKTKNFSHFAIKDNYLMEICDDGFYWWVVGYIKDTSSVDLPKWGGWKFKALMPDGKIKILSDDVVSSCGDTLTLKDGTKAKDLKYKNLK